MAAQTLSPWLICPKPNPRARLRLFCFPYAGGGAQIYQSWPGDLSEQVEVYSLQLPGRGSRWGEPPYNRIMPLVQKVSCVLHPFLDRPFVFFGHSMGSLIGYEVARELRNKYKLNPLLLFASGRPAPHIPEKEPIVHRLPDDDFVNHLKKLNGTPPNLLKDQELMNLMLPILRADFAICETYTYQAESPLSCPISAFGGIEDDEVSNDELEAWREHTTASFSLRIFPGDHFFIHNAKALVLQEISNKLSQLYEYVQ